jgi:hypothetical protein
LPVPKGVHPKYRALVENRIKRGFMSYLSQNLNIKTYMSALRRVEAESGCIGDENNIPPPPTTFRITPPAFQKIKIVALRT